MTIKNITVQRFDTVAKAAIAETREDKGMVPLEKFEKSDNPMVRQAAQDEFAKSDSSFRKLVLMFGGTPKVNGEEVMLRVVRAHADLHQADYNQDGVLSASDQQKHMTPMGLRMAQAAAASGVEPKAIPLSYQEQVTLVAQVLGRVASRMQTEGKAEMPVAQLTGLTEPEQRVVRLACSGDVAKVEALRVISAELAEMASHVLNPFDSLPATENQENAAARWTVGFAARMATLDPLAELGRDLFKAGVRLNGG